MNPNGDKMGIEACCEACGKSYRLGDALAGKRLKCKACGGVVIVPTVFAESASTEESRSSEFPGAVAALVGGLKGASSPARARVDALLLFKCSPGSLIVSAVILVIGVAITAALGTLLPTAICFGIAVLVLVLTFIVHVRIFNGGNVNPAVVIGDSPWTVAVWADLSLNGRTVRPAVMILKQPLQRMAGGPARVGMRLAAPTIYGPKRSDGAWDRIFPMIANCVVSNPSSLARMMTSVPAKEWQALDAAVGRLVSYDPGLYRLWAGAATTAPRSTSRLKRFAVAALILIIAILCTILISLKLSH